MLANLMPPPTAAQVASLEVVESSSAKSKAFVVVHPRYRSWLAKCGLVRPEAFLELHGEIVSGHHDRHVMRVHLAQRVVFLKREHRIGWRVRLRNWRDGFGFVSRSEREAGMLKHFDEKALDGPQLIAYGENDTGQAFLMVDSLAGSLDLRVAAGTVRQPGLRHELCQRVGQTIAEFHSRNVSTPDLAAKHVFVRPDNGAVTVLDWPSAKRDAALTFDGRAHSLAQLDASLAAMLVSPRERLRCLRAYCRRQWGQPKLRAWVAKIQSLQAGLAKRSSIRDQQCDASVMESQRLVWLAENEAVCVTPKIAKHWPQPAVCSPYYFEPPGAVMVTACDGGPATLHRFRTFAPRGRVTAALSGKSWRSPALLMVKGLFRKQREGLATPRVLAFGQRLTGRFTAESFVLLRGSEGLC